MEFVPQWVDHIVGSMYGTGEVQPEPAPGGPLLQQARFYARKSCKDYNGSMGKSRRNLLIAITIGILSDLWPKGCRW